MIILWITVKKKIKISIFFQSHNDYLEKCIACIILLFNMLTDKKKINPSPYPPPSCLFLHIYIFT